MSWFTKIHKRVFGKTRR